MSVLPVGVEPVAYTIAVRAAVLPWNQRRERRAPASTSELDRPAACLNSRPKPRTVSTQFDRLIPGIQTPINSSLIQASPGVCLSESLNAPGSWVLENPGRWVPESLYRELSDGVRWSSGWPKRPSG